MLKIPRRPLISLDAFTLASLRNRRWSEEVGSGRFVTSGRAAIFQALRLLEVGAGDSVLVPTYHCPTMVAPVVALGAIPRFYPLTERGLPNLDSIEATIPSRLRALIVPQLFGFPLDLAEVRTWCDSRGVPMVEDCAHAIMGRAGERQVGEWGNFATASLTKFLPVGELGWLSSALRPVTSLKLHRAGMRAELKALLDPLQIASEHGRMGPVGAALRIIAKSHRGRNASAAHDSELAVQTHGWDRTEREALAACDMGRVNSRPASVNCLIAALTDLTRMAELRRSNFNRMLMLFQRLSIGRPLISEVPADSAPYALPILLEDPVPLYQKMRNAGFPVNRWDRLWPGTPLIVGDAATTWWAHLLQIPTHQSYVETEFHQMECILQRLRVLGAGDSPR